MLRAPARNPQTLAETNGQPDAAALAETYLGVDRELAAEVEEAAEADAASVHGG